LSKKKDYLSKWYILFLFSYKLGKYASGSKTLCYLRPFPQLQFSCSIHKWLGILNDYSKKLGVMQLVHSGEHKMVYLEHIVFSKVLLLFDCSDNYFFVVALITFE
jgi:hypothetical protein